jgi:Raf kinase inhibitor-like YbhB/YbcL family protein
MTLRLRSKAFNTFEEIPVRYTADGANISPPLKWSGVPDGTREFVLICEDPDAPTPKPLLHWLVYGLSANTTFLPEGLPGRQAIEYPVLAHQGRNSLAKTGYMGPKPPIWHSAHHYSFRLFALDAELSVPPEASFDQVVEAMEGHVVGQARLIGYYELRARRQLRENRHLIFGCLGILTSGLVGAWLGRHTKAA